jgi:hypothetical protein
MSISRSLRNVFRTKAGNRRYHTMQCKAINTDKEFLLCCQDLSSDEEIHEVNESLEEASCHIEEELSPECKSHQLIAL